MSLDEARALAAAILHDHAVGRCRLTRGMNQVLDCDLFGLLRPFQVMQLAGIKTLSRYYLMRKIALRKVISLWWGCTPLQVIIMSPQHESVKYEDD